MPQNTPPPKLIVIVGPTASGKSDLGIKIAQKYKGEIISADSRQIYRGMDIGTGKVSKEEQKMVRHYLIDVVSPTKQFTADDFKKLGEKSIRSILAKGKIPIIVGGTGFYIDILLGRMAVAQVPADNKLRAQLDKLPAEELFKKLEKSDPRYSKIIDRHNRRRLIRALEIVITTGKPVPKIVVSSKYQVLWIGINPGKNKLENNIKKRLDSRLGQGMIKEVEKLHRQGVNWKRLDDFGLEYRWVSRYLQKDISYTEMGESLLKDIIKYSKRQMTWFKRNKEIYWVENKKEAYKLASAFLN